MKQSSYKGKSPLPDFVIDAACAGNAEAVERVLQHYDGYINKLCTRTEIHILFLFFPFNAFST